MITIQDCSPQDLNTVHNYYFTVSEHVDQIKLRLVEYAILKRQTPRHKFRLVDKWDIYFPRESTIDKNTIVVPPTIIAKARQQIIDNIVIELPNKESSK